MGSVHHMLLKSLPGQSEGDVTEKWSQRCNSAGFEDGEREAEECRQPLEAGEDKETDSPLEPPEGPRPCQHRDFSPGRSLLDFSSTEL